MTDDFKIISEIIKAAVGKLQNDELLFTFPEVLNVIKLCTLREIAVLGVELFLVTPDGFRASGSSSYELELGRRWPVVQFQHWPKYLRDNNEMAEVFVRGHPLGDDHVYLLTTASWREFKELGKVQRRL
jgi:hypothetical protein